MGATSRLANPGITLGSNANVGTLLRAAANIAGPDAYPPTPITTCGRNSASIRQESHTARGRPKAVLRRVAKLTFLRAPTSTRRSGKPAAGTRRVSIAG